MEACIISKDGELTSAIQQTLRDCAFDCPDANLYHESEILDQAFEGTNAATLSFVAASAYHPELLDILRRLKSEPNSKIILVLPVTSSSNTLEIFRAGASEILTLERSFNEDLVSYLQRFRRSLADESAELTSILASGLHSDANLLAVNLSAVFARLYGGCNLLDIAASDPSASQMLGIEPRQVFDQLLKATDEPNGAAIKSAFTKHKSGIRLLSGSSLHGEQQTPQLERFRSLVDSIKRESPQSVTTCSDVEWFSKTSLFERCNKIILVARLDDESILRARESLVTLHQCVTRPDLIKVVAFCSNDVNETDVAAACKSIGVNELTCIPDDSDRTAESIESGVPYVIDAPRCAASRAILQLALSKPAAAPRPDQSPSRTLGRTFFGALRGLWGNVPASFDSP